MILQALNEYYHRKAAEKNSNVAPEGWEWKEIPYEIVIKHDGNFAAIRSTAEGAGRLQRYHKFLVPQSTKRTVGIKSYLLWDNIEYALGANPRQRDDIELRHNDFVNRITTELGNKEIKSVNALLSFLNNEPLKQIEASAEFSTIWKQMLEENAFLIFSVEGEPGKTICDAVPKQIQNKKTQDSSDGICLITGENKTKIARLHPAVKGVRGTNTSGGALVSFNLSAFNSYGKEQNYNAPISITAAFAYITALNMLLGKDSQNKTNIGDTTTVFWAEKNFQSFDLEHGFAWYISDSPKDDPDRGIKAVKALYEAAYSGQLPLEEGNRFYVLGLSPNAARISVRFWKVGTVRDFAEKIKMHFDDFEIVHGPDEPDYLFLNKILRSTALEFKMENISPNLAGAVITSILDGSQYPIALLHQCIRRIRAERLVNRSRAAILKAYINRFNRINKPLDKEITMSLDKTNTNPGYLLGRLFSVLERVQNASNNNKEPNAGIRDRFYGAFSTTPITVLPLLEKLYGHHLGKIEKSKGFFESIKGEIIDKLNAQNIPAHLTMEEQARFAIGYYHQRQDFFTKKNSGELEQSKINLEEGE
ncbi:MAG: type I-C CRISPR-associated protein Cas8c/Csd1 [Ignavibacteriaceae bacterium]